MPSITIRTFCSELKTCFVLHRISLSSASGLVDLARFPFFVSVAIISVFCSLKVHAIHQLIRSPSGALLFDNIQVSRGYQGDEWPRLVAWRALTPVPSIDVELKMMRISPRFMASTMAFLARSFLHSCMNCIS